jgi:lambda repressor-like predicted transcriptional regulator
MAKVEHKTDQAVAALISCGSIAEAAQVAGIGERTLYSWLADKDFQEQYRIARREVVGQALAQLQRVSSLAVNTLSDIMADREAPASSRVSASKAVLELAIRAVELEDVMSRLENLEEEVQKNGRQNY